MSVTANAIIVAKNVFCPDDHRKLCKIRTFESGNLIEVKHKGSQVWGVDLIVGCIVCGKQYRVNAYNGLVEEIDLG